MLSDPVPLHPDVAKLVRDLEAAALPALGAGAPQAARALLAKMRPARPDAASMSRIEEAQLASGRRVRIYEPEPTWPATILYFHGGGWVLGDLDTSDFATRALAAATGCRILSVDYRLAPEHPFPAAADDALEALRWCCSTAGSDGLSDPVLLAGDSAGANLAAGAALTCDERERAGIAAQILLYPVADCDFTRPSYLRFSEALPLSSEDMRWFWSHYCPEPALRQDPRASLLRSDRLNFSPPTFLALASHDPLLDEGAEFAAALMRRGVPITAKVYPGTVHGFFSMPDRLAPARELLGDISEYIRRIVAPANR